MRLRKLIAGPLLALGVLPACAELAVTQVHPDYTLEELNLAFKYKTTGMAFLPDGRLVLGVIETVGQGEVPAADAGDKVLIVNLQAAGGADLQVREIANTWSQISGITVAEGRIYVSDRDGFYRINNLADPGNLTGNRTLMVKWPDEDKWLPAPYGREWHQWVFTPVYHRGRFYAPYSGSIGPGGWSYCRPTSSMSGAFLTWDSTAQLKALAGGLRSPNGANLDSATGEIFVTDNQGSWLPASTFLRMRANRFYGHRQIPEYKNDAGEVVQTFPPNFAESLPYEPPVAWLPYRGLRCSPSQPIRIPSGPYAGDWLIGDVNNPGLVRVYVDRVDSACNGAAFWFSQGFQNSAINRLAYGPDGALYVGTITRVAGNWPAMEKMPIYRMKAKANPSAFDMRAVRSLNDGLEIEFTGAVDPKCVSPDSLRMAQWEYIRKQEYGLGKQDDDSLKVTKAQLSLDGTRLHLVLQGLKTNRVIGLRFAGLRSEAGKPVWNNEAWFTLNAVSERAWDWGVPLTRSRPAPRAAPAGLRVLAMPENGILRVTWAGAGRFSAELRALDGSLLEAVSGADKADLRPERRGIFLLRIRSARGLLGRTVAY
jgi:hypothetical protein